MESTCHQCGSCAHLGSLQASSSGALRRQRWGVGGGGEEGELATTSLEIEYLHRKSRREMLIGRDDI